MKFLFFIDINALFSFNIRNEMIQVSDVTMVKGICKRD